MTRVTLCDVGPRDGLQNEPETFAPGVRTELVNRLAAAGLPRVEAVSFVRDERVPQMAGAEEVVAAIERRPGTEYCGLVLNERGWERFRATALDRVNVTFAATETFNERNGNATLAEAVVRAEAIVNAADVPATVVVSCSFGCPFEGRVDPARVAELVAPFDGRAEVVLADTIGVATPSAVRALVGQTSAAGFHGHNTRNTGYANALAAVEAGATVLDASIGGLGGCPYAAACNGQYRDRGPRVPARGRRSRDRRRPRRARRDVGVARRRARPPARGLRVPRWPVAVVRAVWALLAASLVATMVTYARLPPSQLYDVTGTGLRGGLSRAVVELNFPDALIALAVLGVLAPHLSRRFQIVAALAAALCVVAVLPGVVKQSDLDARWINAVPALGVGLAFGLTLLVRRLPPAGHDRSDILRAVLAAVLVLIASPWIAAELGFYLDGVPLLGWMFQTGKLAHFHNPLHHAVHHGVHHGLQGLELALAALLLSRLPNRISPYLALMLAYGAANMLNDGWLEQVVERGWSSATVPSVLSFSVNWLWGATIVVAAAIWLLWFGRSRIAASPSP